MIRLLVPLLLAVLAALPLRAEPIHSFTLDNGLEVVVIEDRRAPVVVHMLWYRVGAADEPPGKSGIAHFLEHLMFKGTTTREAGAFSALVEAHGGRDNAFTSWDYTGYFQRIAADRLELVMELEADRLANLHFTDADWLPERDVILEERGQVLESRPRAVFSEQMRAALFQNHPYGVPIIGWRHEMEGLTDHDAMEFYRRHYAPNNAILIVAGDVDAQTVRALAERHYGPHPANPDIAPRQRPQEPPHLAERRLTLVDARVAQPLVQRSYLAPARRPGAQQEAAALAVLAALLGGNEATSVLGRKLIFETQTALSVNAWYSPLALDDGVFGLGVMPAPGVSLAEAETALDRAIAEFIEEGVDAAQFERVMMQIRASEIYALDSAMGRARNIGSALTSGLSLEDALEWPEVLQAVTPEQVLASAALLLDRRPAVTGWLVGPDDAEAM